MESLASFLSRHLGIYASTLISVSLCIIIPYILGSVNFALVISKMFYHDDIRKYGSGNAGMTNMLRTYGKGAALGTLLCDMLKSVVSVFWGGIVFGYIGAYMAGFFCVLGHVFPIFFKFKGGKGVATFAAMILTLSWECFLLLLVIFVIIVAATKYVSLGSVICSMSFPLIIAKIGGIGFPFLFSFATAAIIVFMHRGNIVRIKNHTENKISFSKKDNYKK